MEALVCVVIFRLIVEVVKAARSIAREPKPQPICVMCSFAHVQYAANGRTAISCMFGGGLRSMDLDVTYCTDFRDRTVLVQISPIGFAAGS